LRAGGLAQLAQISASETRTTPLYIGQQYHENLAGEHRQALTSGRGGGDEGMERREWIGSIALIGVLLALVIVLAQSRRECERPGSSYIPCVEFENLWRQADSKRIQMPRRFPSPWTTERIPGGYVVKDATGQSVAYVYARATKAEADKAKALTMDEARRIASNIAKLPTLLARKE
jgi:hypothetical protein